MQSGRAPLRTDDLWLGASSVRQSRGHPGDPTGERAGEVGEGVEVGSQVRVLRIAEGVLHQLNQRLADHHDPHGKDGRDPRALDREARSEDHNRYCERSAGDEVLRVA